jgi:ABC-type uncharacterized transport system auxiliary subunit
MDWRNFPLQPSFEEECMNKKLLSLALVLAVATTLGACDQAAEDETIEPSPIETVSPAGAP